ncbi:hypothetical protein [Haloplanus pelagicus]|jgi:hypothetical protein|uniref:hypothetical protein n=1 Tax=Haloplanus pelagicus TaxID=2949995 RepID=UPI00203C41E0|nr:hypothetical protein [Haloplanus sp. HW8-1]
MDGIDYRRNVEAAIRDGLASDAARTYLVRMGFDVGTYEPLTGAFDDGALTPEDARQGRPIHAD